MTSSIASWLEPADGTDLNTLYAIQKAGRNTYRVWFQLDNLRTEISGRFPWRSHFVHQCDMVEEKSAIRPHGGILPHELLRKWADGSFPAEQSMLIFSLGMLSRWLDQDNLAKEFWGLEPFYPRDPTGFWEVDFVDISAADRLLVEQVERWMREWNQKQSICEWYCMRALGFCRWSYLTMCRAPATTSSRQANLPITHQPLVEFFDHRAREAYRPRS